MIDKTQAQVIANAINTLANILAKPTHEGWRQRAVLEQVAMDMQRIGKEVFPNEEGEPR